MELGIQYFVTDHRSNSPEEDYALIYNPYNGNGISCVVGLYSVKDSECCCDEDGDCGWEIAYAARWPVPRHWSNLGKRETETLAEFEKYLEQG